MISLQNDYSDEDKESTNFDRQAIDYKRHHVQSLETWKI